MNRVVVGLSVSLIAVAGIFAIAIAFTASSSEPVKFQPATEEGRSSPSDQHATVPVADPVAFTGTADSNIQLAALYNRIASGIQRAGDGRIRGRVSLSDGTGVEGVLVSAITANREAGDAELRHQEIRKQFESWVRMGYDCCATDSHGDFELRGLRDCDYRLMVSLRGHQFSPPVTVDKVSPGSEVNFSAVALARLEMDVRLPNGTQPDRAFVQLTGKNNRTVEIWFPGENLVWLRPGRWRMKVFASDDVEYSSREYELHAREGTPLAVMLIDLSIRKDH